MPSPAASPDSPSGLSSVRQPGPTGALPAENLPPLDSQALLGSGSERLIVHEGTVYRLRLTRNGKLILHK